MLQIPQTGITSKFARVREVYAYAAQNAGVPGASKVLARPQRQLPPPTVTVTKYYYFGGTRVAMRKNGAVTWLHSDHLGSASLATDVNGVKVDGSDQRYKPFGEKRFLNSTQPSKFGYTGQRDFTDFGMMDYGARMYSPLLGRFLSADTVVPGAGNPQAWNRYSYVFNNPLGYVDSNGHSPVLAFLLLSLGAGGVGAIVNTGTYYLGKLAANDFDISKTSLTVDEIKVTAGVGFGVGILTPLVGTKTGLLGIMGLAGLGNVTQYFLINKVNKERSTVSGAAIALGLGVIGGLAGGKLGPNSSIANQKVYLSLLKFYRSSLVDDIAKQAVVDDAIALMSTRGLGSSVVSGGVTNILQAIPGIDTLNQNLLDFLATLDSGDLQKWIDENINDLEKAFKPKITFANSDNDRRKEER